MQLAWNRVKWRQVKSGQSWDLILNDDDDDANVSLKKYQKNTLCEEIFILIKRS